MQAYLHLLLQLHALNYASTLGQKERERGGEWDRQNRRVFVCQHGFNSSAEPHAFRSSMQTTSAVRALGTLQISAWCMFSPFLSHPVVGEDCMILHRCVKTGWSGGPAILAKMLPSTFWHLCCWSRSAPENRREWRQRQRLRVNCQSSVYVCCFSSESNVTISEEAASQLAASKIC